MPPIPSIKDVAERSGVSYKTVSRVVNAEPNVTPVTRRKVEDAIAALGYRPDHTARALRRGRTQTLRLLVVRRFERFLTEPFLDEVVAGIVDGAARADYALMLEVAGPHDAGARPRGAAERRVDATILLDGRQTSPFLPPAPQPEPAQDRARGRDQAPPQLQSPHPGVVLPVVALPTRSPRPGVGWVYADFRGGARLVVDHLIGLGHRRIAHLTGRLSLAERDRLRGYRDALAAAGLPLDPALVVAAGHLRHHGYQAVEKLLARGVDFTALFAVNDLTAVGAMEGLQRAGRRVPADVSVAGFDDVYLARYAAPPLTTVRLPAYEMGMAATELAIGAVEGGDMAEGRVFPVALCVRDSTGPAPAAGADATGAGRHP